MSRIETVYVVVRRHRAVTLGAWFEVNRGALEEMECFAAQQRIEHPDRIYVVAEDGKAP